MKLLWNSCFTICFILTTLNLNSQISLGAGFGFTLHSPNKNVIPHPISPNIQLRTKLLNRTFQLSYGQSNRNTQNREFLLGCTRHLSELIPEEETEEGVIVLGEDEPPFTVDVFLVLFPFEMPSIVSRKENSINLALGVSIFDSIYDSGFSLYSNFLYKRGNSERSNSLCQNYSHRTYFYLGFGLTPEYRHVISKNFDLIFQLPYNLVQYQKSESELFSFDQLIDIRERSDWEFFPKQDIAITLILAFKF